MYFQGNNRTRRNQAAPPKFSGALASEREILKFHRHQSSNLHDAANEGQARKAKGTLLVRRLSSSKIFLISLDPLIGAHSDNLS